MEHTEEKAEGRKSKGDKEKIENGRKENGDRDTEMKCKGKKWRKQKMLDGWNERGNNELNVKSVWKLHEVRTYN